MNGILVIDERLSQRRFPRRRHLHRVLTQRSTSVQEPTTLGCNEREATRLHDPGNFSFPASMGVGGEMREHRVSKGRCRTGPAEDPMVASHPYGSCDLEHRSHGTCRVQAPWSRRTKCGLLKHGAETSEKSGPNHTRSPGRATRRQGTAHPSFAERPSKCKTATRRIAALFEDPMNPTWSSATREGGIGRAARPSTESRSTRSHALSPNC